MAIDRGLVVRTALRVLNEVGLDQLSLRRIATEIGVQAPALYWHFTNKRELLDEMAATILADQGRSARLAARDIGWQAWLTEYGRNIREMLLRYRDGARVFSGTYLTDPSMFRPMEQALAKYTSAGFSPHDAKTGLMTIYHYTIGFVIEEQTAHPEPRTERVAVAVGGPAAPAEPLSDDVLFDYDQRFEAGLRIIVRGLG
jgi:AcrR family transcriptional regulator